MRRPTIALILPIRFAVRGFLETDVFPRLREEADLLLISPFTISETFVCRYNGDGVRHAALHDFRPAGQHRLWYDRLQELVKRQWNLTAHQVIIELETYHIHRNCGSLPQRSILWHAKHKAFYSRWGAANPVGMMLARKLEQRTFRQTYDNSYYLDLLAREKPDLVVSTSPNRMQEMPIARAVRQVGIPHITYILSFDNICCYDEYPVIYDHYMVWNDRNKREVLYQYPTVSADQVTICGPLQFDFYHRCERYLVSREQWASDNGLDPARPVILYCETGRIIAPHEVEVVTDLLGRLRATDLQPKPTLLVRTHPMYRPERWTPLREKYPEFHLQITNDSQEQGSLLSLADNTTWDEREISSLINTLHHSAIVLHVSSTMALDAAYFDRPAIGIAYDPRPGAPFEAVCRRLYERDHYLDITNSGGIAIARSGAEALEWIERYLADPSLHRQERLKMLKLYDPFMDGRTGQRVADTILSFL